MFDLITSHLPQILFYGIGGGMLALGILVIGSRNPVNSAMFLVGLFFGMAAIFVVLGAFFLAAIQILVYAGAIVVLFLFVIMFLNLTGEARRGLHWFGLVNGIAIILLLALQFGLLLAGNPPGWVPPVLELAPGGAGATENIGRLLFTNYLLPFEAASMLLLAAIVGAFVLARKEDPQ